MTQKKTGPQPISRILEGALRQYGLHERFTERSVLQRWPEVVGDDIAAHSRAVDLADGVLVLEADHGAWRQELTLLMPEIITKFNELCGAGTVTEIQWRDRPMRGRKRPPRT
jgi:predicted nucleic acid-binding Zn ribbon protein